MDSGAVDSHQQSGPIVIGRIETFLVRVDSDGALTKNPAVLRTVFARGTLYSDVVETLLVRIESIDGAVGWGETLAPVGARAVGAIIDDVLAPLLVGQDAARVRALQVFMQETMRERGHLGGLYADAIAGIDIALWDLVGNHRGLRVADLLGGAFRETIPTYVSSIAGGDDDERAATIRDLRDRGARRFKLHLGHGVAADLASYDALSAAAPGAAFAVDVHGVYSLPSAIALGLGLADRNAWFLESPMPPDALDDFAALSSRVPLPIAAGEAFRNRYEVAAWLRRDALTVYQPDVGRTGITEAAHIGVMAGAALRELTPHHSIALAPALAAGMHIAATTHLMPAFEYQIAAVRNANAIIVTPLEVSEREMHLPVGPGLGIQIREELIREAALER